MTLLDRRRALLGLGALGWPAVAAGADPPVASVDVSTGGRHPGQQSARLLWPRHLPAGARLPGLVLLHGLGETRSPALGLTAWSELYGLGRAFERLLAPPVAPLGAARGSRGPSYLTAEIGERVNAQLAWRPFRGVVAICPVTPNPFREGAAAMQRFARWLTEELLPAARERAPLAAGPVGLDGCSMGGPAAHQVFLAAPERWATLGVIQSAMSAGQAPDLAGRLASAVERVGPRPLHLSTSTRDPYHDGHVALATELRRRGVPAALAVAPGPHDQPWLREVGTLTLLHWHERMLAGAGR